MKRDLRTVQELIAKNEEELLKIKNACESENRARTEDEKSRWLTLQGENRGLKEEEEFLLEAKQLEARAAAKAGIPIQTGLSAKESKDFSQFSLVRGLQLMAQGKEIDGIEAEVHQMACRDAALNGIQIEGFGVPAFITPEMRGQTATGQTTNAGDQGGVSVPTELNGLIEALWAKSFLNKVGATRLAGLQGNQDFMVQDTTPTIQELTEIEQMVEQEILFSKFSMNPNRRGTAIPFSKQLLLQSSLDVQNLIIENIRKALDLKLNTEAITAILAAITSGNGNLIAMGTNGGDPTYASVVAMEALIEGFETGDAANLSFLLNSKTKAKLRQTQIFSGTNGEAVYGKDNTIDGFKAVTSNIVPSNITKGTTTNASAMVFGDFSYLYTGFWGGADFTVDTLTLAKKAQVLVVCNMFWNVKVARAKSFAGVKDYTTA